MNKQIICVAMTTWQGDYVKAVVKLMEALSQDAKVLFVNYQYTWKDLILSILGKSPAPWKSMLGFKNRLQQEGKVTVMTPPPVLPINWIKHHKIHALFNRFNGWVLAKSMKTAMKKLGITSPIMINAFNPAMGVSIKNRISTAQTYYYCYDEISQSDWCKIHGPTYEKDFVKGVDGVFVSSVNLQQKFEGLNQHVRWIPNGVDFELFNSALQSSKRPKSSEFRVAFIGSFDFRIDYALLAYLTENLPRVQFDLVGRILEKEEIQKLSEKPNIKVHGSKQPEELPDYLATADAGIIPFIKNEFTRNIYPMKINEYLAAGLPVVSTDFADLSSFEGVIHQGKSHQNFLESLLQALQESDREWKEVRREIARCNDWHGRAMMFWKFHQKASAAS